jgi:hypothetical protein
VLKLLCGCSLAASFATSYAEGLVPSNSQFAFKDASGQLISVPIAGDDEKRKLVAKVDPSLDPKLVVAATLAQERSNAHSQRRCWKYVKNALVAAGVISSRPETALAKDAGEELERDYGFKKLPISDPYDAPIGAVLVYGASRAAGHVEIRTKDGFASDFSTPTPSKRPLIGVYAKS